MEVDLRDLEADRRLLEAGDISYSDMMDLSLDALDEIDRLKRLMVWRVDGKWYARTDRAVTDKAYSTEAAAWAAVRKAACE